MKDPDRIDYYEKDRTPEPGFFFYDLETSGLDPRADRIMQFAGIRTDLSFHQVGEPVDLLVKLSEDTLPSPFAINVTKITPQQTQLDGLTEAEFCKYVSEEIFTPGTIAVGYNSIRFDDEFMRCTFWRNFYDPYEWEWKDGRSRWDLLDVVRLTRALRPEGIAWPVQEVEAGDFDAGGDRTGSHKELRATNRLELLTKENHIEHKHAHDALSDVEALISVTQLIHDRSPKLYDYLFRMRGKDAVKQLVNLERPREFVYACGRYPAKYQKTSVAFPVGYSKTGGVYVYDLRYSLDEVEQAEKDFKPSEKNGRFGKFTTKFSFVPFIKELSYNKCPAVAPVAVLDVPSEEDSADPAAPHKKGTTGWEKIGLTREQIEKNKAELLSHPEFIARALKELNSKPEWPKAVDGESALYDGFLGDPDRALCRDVRTAGEMELSGLHPDFDDPRLPELLAHYKARNFPGSLDDAERREWERYRLDRLKRTEPSFVSALEELQKLAAAGRPAKDGRPVDASVLEDLVLWYQSLSPTDFDEGRSPA